MPVRPRVERGPGVWWVDFRVGGKRHQLTVRAKDEDEALAQEAALRAGAVKARALEMQEPWRYDPDGRPTGRSHWKRLLDNARDRARTNGLPFKLTKDDLDWLLARAGGHCELTGIPFCWDWHPNARRRPFVPSLHRIKPELGYVRSNLRVVCIAANIAVNEWGEDVFFTVAMSFVSRRFRMNSGNFLATNTPTLEAVNGYGDV